MVLAGSIPGLVRFSVLTPQGDKNKNPTRRIFRRAFSEARRGLAGSTISLENQGLGGDSLQALVDFWIAAAKEEEWG